MEYKIISLFGKQLSRGTFDDFFDVSKFDTLRQAYNANDYVECNFVKDENGVLFIEAKNVKYPDIKKYHRLNIQRPVFGLDVSDDAEGFNLAKSLF